MGSKTQTTGEPLIGWEGRELCFSESKITKFQDLKTKEVQPGKCHRSNSVRMTLRVGLITSLLSVVTVTAI